MLSPPRAVARGPGSVPDGSVPENTSDRLERLLQQFQQAGADIKRGAEPAHSYASRPLPSPAPEKSAEPNPPSLELQPPLGLFDEPTSPTGPADRPPARQILTGATADPRPVLGSAPSAQADRHPTGLEEIDRLLGGGLPRGRLCEIAGPASCGRTSLAHALLARTTAAGELACVIDRANAFDPASAHEGGIDLRRVLWARPPGATEALRCAEHVLRAEGFALVLLDLAMVHETPRFSSAVWPRLRKVIASGSAAFVVLSRERMVGSFADLALELDEVTPSFETGPSWLAGLEGRVLVARNRTGPDQRSVAVRWWSHEERAA